MSSPVLSALAGSTELQRAILRFAAVLSQVREQLGERERQTFAAIASRMFERALAAELVVAEAERLTRQAT